MIDIRRLLSEFQADFEAGGSLTPGELLARVHGTDRRELAALLDAYLARAPRRRFSSEALSASPASIVVDDLTESLVGRAGTWPFLLPRLRNAARIRRDELVARLAAGLGVSGREDQVAIYYHQMEHGSLNSAGVSDRVLRVLAELVGTTVETLRNAGAALTAGGGPDSAPGPAFARIAHPDPDPPHGAPLTPASPGTAPAARAPDPDEDDTVAQLFTGGPGA